MDCKETKITSNLSCQFHCAINYSKRERERWGGGEGGGEREKELERKRQRKQERDRDGHTKYTLYLT